MTAFIQKQITVTILVIGIKSFLADLCQSTVLEFITEQLVPNNHQLHIPQSQRNKVAKLIRESEYGIC